jgi:hypothetical protein
MKDHAAGNAATATRIVVDEAPLPLKATDSYGTSKQ